MLPDAWRRLDSVFAGHVVEAAVPVSATTSLSRSSGIRPAKLPLAFDRRVSEPITHERGRCAQVEELVFRAVVGPSLGRNISLRPKGGSGSHDFLGVAGIPDLDHEPSITSTTCLCDVVSVVDGPSLEPCPFIRQPNLAQEVDQVEQVRTVMHGHGSVHPGEHVNPPGVSGDVIPWKDQSHGTSQHLPARAS